MSWMSFLESLFCSNCHRRVAELEKQVLTLIEEKGVLARNYQNLMMEKLELVLNCGKDALDFMDRVNALQDTIDALQKAALESFEYPKIPSYSYVSYDVSNISDFYTVEFVRSDVEYLLFSKDDWVKILNVTYPLVKEAMERWVTDISDCDNWALTTAAIVNIAFKKSGYTKQGAFAIAHTVLDEPSRHAYNLLVDRDRKIWVYEPQTNRIVGEMKEGLTIYRTGFTWFMS